MASYELLKTYKFLNEAELDLIKLKDEGIKARMSDSNTVSVAPHLGPAVGGIKLYVPENKTEEAQEVLSGDHNTEKNLEKAFDEEDIEPAVRCPKCQSPKIIYVQSFLWGILYLLSFVMPISAPSERYHCANCDHIWAAEEYNRD